MISKEILPEIDARIKDVEEILTRLRALRNQAFRDFCDERAKAQNEKGASDE